MTTNTDYWPDDLLENIPSTPRQVMDRVAAQLGTKTRNLVLADVETRTLTTGDFLHDFYFRVPSLRYRYDLFTLQHDISLYPVATYEPNGASLRDEAQLESYIREKINSPETIKIVRSLIAQAALAEPPLPF